MPAQVTNYQMSDLYRPAALCRRVRQAGVRLLRRELRCGADRGALRGEGGARLRQRSSPPRKRPPRKRKPPRGASGILSDLSADWGAEGEGMKAYNCPSCGAQLICDATTAATSCPYCGNPTVVPGQFAGTLKPDFVIPFKLSREDAIQRLKQHYKGKVFLPKSFSSENHLQEIQRRLCSVLDVQRRGGGRRALSTRTRSRT